MTNLIDKQNVILNRKDVMLYSYDVVTLRKNFFGRNADGRMDAWTHVLRGVTWDKGCFDGAL